MRCLAALFLCLLLPTYVEAKPSQFFPVTQYNGDRITGVAQASARQPKARYLYRTKRHASRHPAGIKRQRLVPQETVWGGFRREVSRATGRPAAWCGWWLGHHLGMPRRDLWLARNWASVGSNVGQPGVGVVVVWRHHVGIITGRQGNQWIVKSGNDGRRVRERPRSVAGAIAFRRV